MTSERLESAVATRAKLWQAASVDPSSCGHDDVLRRELQSAYSRNSEQCRAWAHDAQRLTAALSEASRIQEGQTGRATTPAQLHAVDAELHREHTRLTAQVNRGKGELLLVQHEVAGARFVHNMLASRVRSLLAQRRALSSEVRLAEQVRHPPLPTPAAPAHSQERSQERSMLHAEAARGAAGGEHALGLAAEESLARNLKRLEVQECRHVQGLAQRRAQHRTSLSMLQREHAGAVQSVHTATESADDLTQGVDAEPLPQMPFCRGPQVPSAASAPVRELGVLEAEVQRLKTRLVDREEELAALRAENVELRHAAERAAAAQAAADARADSLAAQVAQTSQALTQLNAEQLELQRAYEVARGGSAGWAAERVKFVADAKAAAEEAARELARTREEAARTEQVLRDRLEWEGAARAYDRHEMEQMHAAAARG